jgi:hypothetical protein
LRTISKSTTSGKLAKGVPTAAPEEDDDDVLLDDVLLDDELLDEPPPPPLLPPQPNSKPVRNTANINLNSFIITSKLKIKTQFFRTTTYMFLKFCAASLRPQPRYLKNPFHP